MERLPLFVSLDLPNLNIYYFLAFFISIFFFILIHSISGYIYSQFTLNRTIISFLCIPSIILILLAVFGGISLFGFPINLLHFSTPLIGLTILNSLVFKYKI